MTGNARGSCSMSRSRCASGFRACIITAGFFLLAALDPVWSADTLQPGEVLGPDNWQKAEGLLPPEILKHYRNGEYANAIAPWGDRWVKWGTTFLGHSDENAKWLDLDDKGSIIDKRTGQRPTYVDLLSRGGKRSARPRHGRDHPAGHEGSSC